MKNILNLIMYVSILVSGIIAPVILIFQGGFKYVFYGLVFAFLLGPLAYGLMYGCLMFCMIFIYPIAFTIVYLWKRFCSSIDMKRSELKILSMYIVDSFVDHLIVSLISILIFTYIAEQNLAKLTFLLFWGQGCLTFFLISKSQNDYHYQVTRGQHFHSLHMSPILIASSLIGVILVFNNMDYLNKIPMFIIIPMIFSWIMDIGIIITSNRE